MKWLFLLTLVLWFAPLSLAQEVLDEEETEITSAPEADVKALLSRLKDAREEQDGMRIGEVLAAMSGHDNPEFLEAAIEEMAYKASTHDKRQAREQAKEMGTMSKKDIDIFTYLREAEVQIACAHVLANFPEDKGALKALLKAYKDKAVQKEKPTVMAAVIGALGRMGYRKLEKDMLGFVEKGKDKEIAQAAVRYFGQIKTTDYGIVRKLAEKLTPPQPAAVDDPNNPSGDYWAAQWEVWSWTRRDVTWTLKQITGQVFQPAEGEHAGDTKKALDYIKQNKRELGLR
ncbi:MAG: HEAT repeat domain-containing protein [Planctomycetota bacterium]|nr:HEAT repeat domain-containing protein [Planctomycetota bacterium]